MDSGAGQSGKIFDAIQELMTNSEFVTANMQFFNLHCDKFDENVEENKHEYKQIYEDFLKIQEDVIESKLKEAFTEDQIIEFYSTFEDNMKDYEAKDKDTLDFLFEMIDFDKFKAKMCAQKALSNAEKKGADDINRSESSMILDSKDSLNIEKEKLLFDSYHSESLTSVEIGWKKRLEQKEWKNNFKLTIHSRRQKDSPIDIFRIELQLKVITVEQLFDFFFNCPIEKMPMMVEQTYSDRVEHENGGLTVTRYQRTSSPMISDRDSVCIMVQDTHRGHRFIATQSIKDDHFPEVKDVVRMLMHEVILTEQVKVEGEDIVRLTCYAQIDVKGYIPVSMINMSGANNYFKYFDLMVQIMQGQK